MNVLSQYLLTVGGQGKTVVVVLDEAQQMSVEALEQIRILSTMETATRKLLQIVLVGQPELEEKLQRRDLRQLDQRIGIRCYLKPLSRKETFRYVEHRLRIAGLPGAVPFARSALGEVYRKSRGIPRVINLVCDRALTAAFAARAKEISPALVRAAMKNLEGDRPRRLTAVRSRQPVNVRAIARVAAGVAAVVLVGAAGAGAYRSGWSPTALPILPRLAATSPAPAETPEPVVTPAAQAIAVAATPPSAPTLADRGGRLDAAAPADDAFKSVLARALRLWGVTDDPEAVIKGWPLAADGVLDVAAMAARYQLAATRLPETTLDELRAVDLPAIVELEHQQAARPYLLRRMDNVSAVLVSPSGSEARVSLDELDGRWTRSAWLIWRNVDLLPMDPNQDLSPIVVATLALRFQKLGLLEPPVPTTNSERFRQAVQRFQESMGLTPDGVVGPRTTLALSRVVAGRFGPTLANSPTR